MPNVVNIPIFEKPPCQFVCMPILSQLRDILARAQYLNFQRQDQSFQPTSTIKDISHGAAYDRILLEQSSTRFISLFMNVDGINIAKSSNTFLWIITFVINELKRTERFKLKNVIVAGVLSCKTKPSRGLPCRENRDDFPDFQKNRCKIAINRISVKYRR